MTKTFWGICALLDICVALGILEYADQLNTLLSKISTWRPRVKNRNRIRLVMSITNGRIVRDFEVHDDKRPGGLQRMQLDAFKQAQKCSDFSRGDTLNIVTNWVRPEVL